MSSFTPPPLTPNSPTISTLLSLDIMPFSVMLKHDHLVAFVQARFDREFKLCLQISLDRQDVLTSYLWAICEVNLAESPNVHTMTNGLFRRARGRLLPTITLPHNLHSPLKLNIRITAELFGTVPPSMIHDLRQHSGTILVHVDVHTQRVHRDVLARGSKVLAVELADPYSALNETDELMVESTVDTVHLWLTAMHDVWNRDTMDDRLLDIARLALVYDCPHVIHAVGKAVLRTMCVARFYTLLEVALTTTNTTMVLHCVYFVLYQMPYI